MFGVLSVALQEERPQTGLLRTFCRPHKVLRNLFRSLWGQGAQDCPSRFGRNHDRFPKREPLLDQRNFINRFLSSILNKIFLCSKISETLWKSPVPLCACLYLSTNVAVANHKVQDFSTVAEPHHPKNQRPIHMQPANRL